LKPHPNPLLLEEREKIPLSQSLHQMEKGVGFFLFLEDILRKGERLGKKESREFLEEMKRY
ncbi:MAG: hypothetical protein LBC61_07160, partial [Candidatus Peribacteria bacterium]|jgi:hypothetical protein|nr:hypothetical protein [Candidatus Peribacteria bacterium]